jgi:hypothetical protein
LCYPEVEVQSMTDDEKDDRVDPVLQVLTEYEQKLKELHRTDQLAREAQRTFGALVTELERRGGVDRRAKARAERDRRGEKTPDGALVP